MEIDINQKMISLGAEYHIHINGKEQYFATKKLFRFLSEIHLFDESGGRARYEIKKNWSWLMLSYNLIQYDKNVFEFRAVSFWKRHYACQIGADIFELYGHNGRKYSIYKNDKQIAWWDKNAVTWFSGDNYKIIANSSAEIELLICFCLIMDNKHSRNTNGNTVTYDLGNFGFQAKEFNPHWAPTD